MNNRIKLIILVSMLILGSAVRAEIATSQRVSSMVYLVEINDEETASEACYREDMSCLSVTTAKLFDNDDKFYGFVTPSCDSQVVKKDECKKDFKTDYAIDNVVFKKSPKAKSDQVLTANYFCLSSDKGKKGIYTYAYCVKR